jgi:hypothetical protein
MDLWRTLLVFLMQSLTIILTFESSWSSLWTSLIWLAAGLTSLLLSPSAAEYGTSRRLIASLAIFLISTVALGIEVSPMHVRPAFIAAWRGIEPFLLPGHELGRVQLRRTLAWSAGVLLCIAPANDLLLVTLTILKIRPPSGVADLRHYKHGGLIGVTERILVMIFVVNGAFNAVGFVITAKGLVRFREIADHSEGEYVLVGTLLSTLLAICLGLLLPHLAG